MQVSSVRFNQLWMGLIIVFGVGALSWWLARYLPSLGNVTLAILLGVLVGNLLVSTPATDRGGQFAEKQLLPVAIVLLGVELQLDSLIALGPLAAVIILISISTSVFVSLKLGEWMGFSRQFSLLIGAGNGICGSSAVAATSMSIKADEADTGISIGVVNLLGTLGIFIMPLLIRSLSLNDVGGGLLVGGSLQAFGQVLAAGFSVNNDVGQIATVVKMGRVLMLGPMVIWIGMWMQAQNVAQGGEASAVHIPRFILGFFLMSIFASLNLLPASVVSLITTAGKFLLVVAMAGIGMRIQLRTLFRSGLWALLFGAAVWLVQIMVLLVVIVVLVGH